MFASSSSLLRVAALVAAGLILGAASAASAQPVGGPGEASPVQLSVVADRAAVAPGGTMTVAFRFQIQPKWHVYWTNPGGYGLPTTVAWTLPEGFEAGELRSPPPHVYDSEATGGYVHEGETVLLVDIRAPAELKPGSTVKLAAKVEWQSCDELQCIPGEKEVSIELPVADEAPIDASVAELFEAARSKLPAGPDAIAVEVAPTAAGYTLTVAGLPESDDPATEFYFYSEADGVIDWKAKQVPAVADGALVLTLTAHADAKATAQRLRGVLVSDRPLTADGATAVRIDTPVGGSGATSGPGVGPNTGGDPDKAPVGMAAILGLAFLGGLVLNVMPCVFPIISIKILGFVKQSGESRKKIRAHGLSFAGGVMISFWVLSGVLLALRAAGDKIGWGFQLQDPTFVAGMAILMVLIGLNLAGVFEVGLSLTTAAGKAETQRGEGYGGSFFSGVLATLIATPCTGPFMGTAVGAALSQPAYIAWLIFTFVGLGMAVPYVVLAWFPRWLAYLPKAGPWMESFKQFMAFPMFLTAVWLVWVFSTITSDTQFVWLLVGLTVLAFGAWWYGRWGTPMRRPGVRWAARIAFAVCLAGAFYIALTESQEMTWEPHSDARLAELRAEGRPVIVDFTASWCGICQWNKKTVLRTDAAERLYAEHDVALLERDWSRRDAETLQILQRFGRAGVPLYLVYPTDPTQPPQVLPNALTMGIVREAIEQADAPTTAAGKEP